MSEEYFMKLNKKIIKQKKKYFWMYKVKPPIRNLIVILKVFKVE